MSWSEWVRTAEVEPSIYAADFSCLGEQLETLLRGGVRIFQFDVGDGQFVTPITIGSIVLKSIAPIVHAGGGVLDCHLMIVEPQRHFAALPRRAATASPSTTRSSASIYPTWSLRRASAGSRSG